MFCEKCGAKIENQSGFCPNCGAKRSVSSAHAQPAQQRETGKLTPGLSWVILAICALLLIVALSLALDANSDHDYLRTGDLIGPIICSIISLGASAFVMLNAKRERANNPKFKLLFFAALVVLILSAWMALEVCIGPAIGEAGRKK